MCTWISKHYLCIMTSEVFLLVWVRWLEPGSGKQISVYARRPRGRWGGHWRTESRQIWWFPRSQDDRWMETVKAEIMNKTSQHRPNLWVYGTVFGCGPISLNQTLTAIEISEKQYKEKTLQCRLFIRVSRYQLLTAQCNGGERNFIFGDKLVENPGNTGCSRGQFSLGHFLSNFLLKFQMQRSTYCIVACKILWS